MLSRIVAFLGRLSPHAAALVHGGSAVSFSRLHRDSEVLARQIRARLAPEHRHVAVVVANGFLRWAALIALDRLGLCASVAADAAEAERLGADAVVADPAVADATIAGATISDRGARSGGLPVLVLDWGWTGPGGDLPPAPGLHDPARLRVFASATGPLAFDSRHTDARLAQFGVGFAPGAARLLQVSEPLDVLGFHQTVAHWLQGGCVVTPPPGARWVEVLRTERVDLVLARPAALDAALDGATGDLRPGRPLTLVVTGPPTARAAEAARARLADRVLVLHHHDAVGLCAVEPLGRLDLPAGRALRPPWFCETQIVGAGGEGVAAGTFGTVRHRSASQVEAQGEGAAGLAAPHWRDGWFYPGQTGRWLPPGGVELELAPAGAPA